MTTVLNLLVIVALLLCAAFLGYVYGMLHCKDELANAYCWYLGYNGGIAHGNDVLCNDAQMQPTHPIAPSVP